MFLKWGLSYKNSKLVKITFLLFFGIIATVEAACEYEQTYDRVALVIGNSDYQQVGSLRNTVNDASDIAHVLRAYEFAVIERLNLTHQQMQQTVRCFANTLKENGVGLFYYAGHGVQIGDRNYLLPVDFYLQDKNPAVQFKAHSTEANEILRILEDNHSATNIIILDACRNNPFQVLTRGIEQAQETLEITEIADKNGLAPMVAPPGSYIAFATEPGNTSSDGVGENGLFTEKLLQFIKQPMLEITQVFNQTRAEVVKASYGKQVPWTRSSMLGSFYFSPLVREVDKRELAYFSATTATFKAEPQRDISTVLDQEEYKIVRFRKFYEKGIRFLEDKGRPDKAIVFFKKALQFNPDNIDTYYYLGLANLELNDLPESIYLFKQVIKQAPNYAPAYDKLAESYELLGDKENAAFYRAKSNEGVMLNYQD